MDFIINSKTHGKFIVLIDEEDYEKIKIYTWGVQYSKRSNTFYVSRKEKNKTFLLHRLITNCPDGLVVDHINHNTLDNRKCNLRVCDNSENCRNMNKPKHGVTSIYKGVRKYRNNKYSACIKHNKKQIHIGYYYSEIEAAIAYNEAALKYHGEFSRLNIIN